jgi:hypothetical protein
VELDNTFTISAKTCTLKYNNQESHATILDNGTKYVIPIYQRPYSWTEKQLRKFISDIFTSFWGNEGNSNEEPMFIGTMQLSTKNSNNEQDIIDGQQRLTTFLIFIKVLKIKFPSCEELSKISLAWLSTRVNNGKQQLYFQEVITSDLTINNETLNPYLKNAYLINELIEEQTKDEEGKPLPFDIDKFVRHLLSNVYFVVIETRAGISKTLQIFNAINTTGLDLNGGDIFKIRMYEYLRDKKGKDERAFDEISRLYYLIDEHNAKLKYIATDIRGILGIYQNILIAKYNLPVTLYSYGTDTFFERLFDTIFNINQWEHFKNNVTNIDLSIEDIERIIQVRYEWENNWYKTAEDLCCYKLIEHSRYGRFADLLPVILLFRNIQYDRYNFVRLLSKVYFIYSVRFQKSIYEINNWTYELIKEIINGDSYESIISKIKGKISDSNTHNNGYYNLNLFISENLTDNATRKNLICRLSAMLEEDYKTTDKSEIEKIKNVLFETPIDIEHIQSYHDSNGDKREDIWIEWQESINSIGNLMVLEQEINRSIRNNPYEIKISRYPESNFSIVKKQPIEYSTWDLEKCMLRKQKETEKILNYIFN